MEITHKIKFKSVSQCFPPNIIQDIDIAKAKSKFRRKVKTTRIAESFMGKLNEKESIFKSEIEIIMTKN